MGAFSAATRAAALSGAGARSFDLLVVGGGITGVGIAREAAGRGLDVAVVEAGDVGGGTSSRSSRLIHGGLRYLETFDFALVFEALAERRRLLRLAPHLVRPLPFLYPVYRGRGVGPWMLRAGLWTYDALALFRGLPRHRMLNPAGVAAREPRLRREGLRGGAVYYDAQVDDARLTLAVARAAHEAGATVLPRAAVVDFLRDDGGRLTGAVVEDRLSGGTREFRARLVLSAAGPWTDEVRRLADPAIRPRLRPTKGVHIILPASRVGNAGAIIFRSPVDGRVMFVLPWRGFTYVGTTDTDYTGHPEDVTTTGDDVAYLLASANGLFPGAALAPDDVIGSWAGVRPLLAEPDEHTPGGTSREHHLWRDPSGLLCIAGGKLTTFRPMAAEAAEHAARLLEREHGVAHGDFHSEHLPLPGAPSGPMEAFVASVRRAAAELGVDGEAADRLAAAHGTGAFEILARIRADTDLGRRLLPDLPYLAAEIPHAVEQEMALTLDDFMRRRTHIHEEDAAAGRSAAVAIAARMGPLLGWSEERVRREVESVATA